MGTRGKKSAAALAVKPIARASKHVEPPGDLPEAGAALWRQIVQELPPEHFRFGDLPLLENFCRAVLLADEAQTQIDADGLVVDTRLGPKPNPALAIRDQAVKQQAALAAKLRLCVSSRVRAEDASLRKLDGPRPWDTRDPDEEFFR